MGNMVVAVCLSCYLQSVVIIGYNVEILVQSFEAVRVSIAWCSPSNPNVFQRLGLGHVATKCILSFTD
jgi:hypothetical protein